MTFEVTFALPAGTGKAKDYFPPLDTWLRLNPQWSVLSAPEAIGDDVVLHLQDEQRDEEIRPRARYLAQSDRGEWQLELELGETSPCYTVRLLDSESGASLRLTAEGAANEDPATRTNLALWQRSTLDYILLSMRTGIGSRLTKFFLDRLWLKLSQPGRRLVFMVIVSEIAALAIFILWLVWELLFG